MCPPTSSRSIGWSRQRAGAVAVRAAARSSSAGCGRGAGPGCCCRRRLQVVVRDLGRSRGRAAPAAAAAARRSRRLDLRLERVAAGDGELGLAELGREARCGPRPRPCPRPRRPSPPGGAQPGLVVSAAIVRASCGWGGTARAARPACNAQAVVLARSSSLVAQAPPQCSSRRAERRSDVRESALPPAPPPRHRCAVSAARCTSSSARAARRGRGVGRGEALGGAGDVLRHPPQQPRAPGRRGQPGQVLGDRDGGGEEVDAGAERSEHPRLGRPRAVGEQPPGRGEPAVSAAHR